MQSEVSFLLSSSRIKNDHFEQRLLCIICNNILWKPIACSSCYDHFCSSCIHTWITESKNVCPKCKSIPFKGNKAIPLVNGMLGDLRLECIYSSNGCKEDIPYDSIEIHERNCLYSSIKCKNCNECILKKDVEEHKNDCAEIEFKCNLCEMKIKKKLLKEHNKESCYLNTIVKLKEKIG